MVEVSFEKRFDICEGIMRIKVEVRLRRCVFFFVFDVVFNLIFLFGIRCGF